MPLLGFYSVQSYAAFSTQLYVFGIRDCVTVIRVSSSHNCFLISFKAEI